MKRKTLEIILTTGAIVGFAAISAGKAAAAEVIEIQSEIQSQSPAGNAVVVSPELQNVVDYVKANECAIFAAAVDAEATNDPEYPLVLTLTPPSECSTKQNMQKGIVYQVADLENALGLQFSPKENVLLLIQKAWAKYGSVAGRSIDPNKVDVTYAGDGKILITDNVYPDVLGITGVRPGHLIWRPGTKFFLPKDLVANVNIEYVKMEVDGKTPPPSGECDVNAGYVVSGFEDGKLVCTKLPNYVPLVQPGDTALAPGTQAGNTAETTGKNPGDTPPGASKGPECKKWDFPCKIKQNKGTSNPSVAAKQPESAFAKTPLEKIAAYGQISGSSQQWTTKVETPDENGVPMQTTEKSDDTFINGGVAVVYNFIPQIGFGAEINGRSTSGTDKGFGYNAAAVLRLGDEKRTGNVELKYVLTDSQKLESNDGPLNVSRDTTASGFAAGYSGTLFLDKDKEEKNPRSLSLAANYQSLTGKSDTTVEFKGEPSLPDVKNKEPYNETSMGLSAQGLFLPVGNRGGVLGVEGGFRQTEQKVGDSGNWTTNSWNAGIAYKVNLGKVDLGVGVDYVAGSQDAHDSSVKGSNMNGVMATVTITPAGKPQWVYTK